MGAKNHCNQYSYLASRGKQEEMSMTNHAAGIGTCTQSGMINPSHPSSEMHLGKFTRPYGISELDCELPSRGLLEGEESHAGFAVDQGNRSSQIAEGPHQSKINYGKRSLIMKN